MLSHMHSNTAAANRGVLMEDFGVSTFLNLDTRRAATVRVQARMRVVLAQKVLRIRKAKAGREAAQLQQIRTETARLAISISGSGVHTTAGSPAAGGDGSGAEVDVTLLPPHHQPEENAGIRRGEEARAAAADAREGELAKLRTAVQLLLSNQLRMQDMLNRIYNEMR